MKKMLITCLSTTVTYVLLEMGLHGGLLSGLYHETAHLWRPEAEMKNLFLLMPLGEACFGFFFGLIYLKGYEMGKGTIAQGLRYGLLMGLMLGPASGLIWYVVLSIPVSLALAWGLGCLAQLLIVGAVAGLVTGDRPEWHKL